MARIALATAATASAMALALLSARASDWPQWRGPNRDGISTETGWLTNWPPREVWRKTIGWRGLCSVAVRDGRLYTSSLVYGASRVGSSWVYSYSNALYCLNASTGDLIWRQTYPTDSPTNFVGNLYGPMATPAVDGNEVFTFDPKGELHCFDRVSGTPLWNRSVDVNRPFYAYAASPLVIANRIYLNAGGAGVAVDRNPPHDILWPVASPPPSEKPGYGSPVALRVESRPVLLFLLDSALTAVNPDDGSVYWSYAYGDLENSADPVVDGDRIFLCEKGGVLLQPTLTGPIEVWPGNGLNGSCTTPVLLGNYAYYVDRAGALVCVDVRDGAALWTQPGFVTQYGTDEGTGYRQGPLIAADGRLIVFADGLLRVVRASPNGFDEEGRAAVQVVAGWSGVELGNYARTLPVLCNGRIYCRIKNVLVCYQAGPNPPEDADADGIADSWTQRFFPGGNGQSTADPDRDGMSNLAEYIAGTDPLDRQSVLKLQAPVVANRRTLTLATVRPEGVGYGFDTRYYCLQFRCLEFLMDPSVGGWSDVPGYSRIPGDGRVVILSDPSADARRCYRVRARLD